MRYLKIHLNAKIKGQISSVVRIEYSHAVSRNVKWYHQFKEQFGGCFAFLLNIHSLHDETVILETQTIKPVKKEKNNPQILNPIVNVNYIL